MEVGSHGFGLPREAAVGAVLTRLAARAGHRSVPRLTHRLPAGPGLDHRESLS